MLGRKEWVLWITLKVGRVALAPFFRLEVTGAENLPNNSAFVLLPKHQRWEDIPLLSLATPIPLYYVAKYELFTNAMASWYLKALGGIPLNRNKPLASRHYIKSVVDYLKNGEAVVVFPEGTYFKGKMGPGQIGMVKFILSRMALPFIPVGINYAKDGVRTRVRVRYGRPILSDPKSSPEQFLEQMMSEIAELSGLK
jgi:1-acyl-sn-glycerol-3-phosphate acyltransferase